MVTFSIPSEEEFKRWIREAVQKCITKSLQKEGPEVNGDEPLLNRKEITKVLRVSLVTLTDWMKRGLPSHKQRGRVYFIRSEVMEYIKKNNLRQVRYSSRFIDTE